MKPKIIFLNVLALLTFEGFSQSTASVIASAGGTGVANEISLEWTLGETISGSGSDASILLTQGFEQPLIVVTKAIVPEIKAGKLINSSVFPNPVNAVLNVKTWSAIHDRVTLSLLDLNGNIVVSKQASANDLQQIEMTKLPAAIYLLRVTNNYGVVISTYRIVKAK